jgi:hypothetical protein
MPSEMSPVDRVRHARTTCGTNETVVHADAANPTLVARLIPL